MQLVERVNVRYYNDATVIVNEGSSVREIYFKIQDYLLTYSDSVMTDYLNNEISPSMTELEKLEAITNIVARDFDYNGNYSGWRYMVAAGGGDCWASTDFILEACKRTGIKAGFRRAIFDMGALSNHANVLAEIDGKLYIADAGFSAKKPRSYRLYETPEFKFWRTWDEDGNCYCIVVQYERDWANDTTSPKIVIPAEWNGYPVKEIHDNFYPSAGETVEYVLPETITKIGSYAFQCNRSLTTINLPENLETIGDNAFSYCSSLGNITIPGKVTELTDYVFASCGTLRITIPASVTTISDTAFDRTDVTLVVDPGSAAEAYAVRLGLNYELTSKTYTVVYNANGGSGSMPDQSFVVGTSKATAANTFIRPGYTFSGWNVYRNSDGRWQCDGNVWQTDAEMSASGLAKRVRANKYKTISPTDVHGDVITLYAVWKPITYTIVYDANGGTGSMAPKTCTYNVSTATSANAFSRTGYVFRGCNVYRISDGKWQCGHKLWKTEQEMADSGSVKRVLANKYITIYPTTVNGDTVTLYAVWEPITYTIVYNANGGTGYMASKTYTYNVSTATSANAFTRTGYTFQGWNVYRESDKKWQCGSKIWKTEQEMAQGGFTKRLLANKYKTIYPTTVNGDTVKLYAVWKPITYSIMYLSNYGDGYMSMQTFTYGISQATAANTFTRPGYTFKGWYCFRNSDNKWLCNDVGWVSRDEIDRKGYTKRLRANQYKSKWPTTVDGDSIVLYAVWKKNN